MNYLYVYGAALAVILILYLRRSRRLHQSAAQELKESLEAGLAEPASLHPVVNPARCMGSGSCARACPEDALGVVRGKAVLINASACIGHGACLSACPVEAISLVFGTEKRGIDIPNISPEFETNVPGIYIAGELGGMGLIRKAAEQGRQAIEAIRKRSDGSRELDVLIVGCGPAGLSAGLSAIHHKLRYRIIEQEDSLGGAVYHYPRNKITMTAPVQLAIVGKVKFGEVSKEKLLEFWTGVVQSTGLQVNFRERLTGIERDGDGFVVQTDRARYSARSVLLAMGRRGTPRKLDVPGEEHSKVVYRLVDPEQYRGQKVLVVGGGDSALEAAIALAEQPGTRVTLSYRSAAFSRVKAKNRERVDALRTSGGLEVLLESSVNEIGVREVKIAQGGQTLARANDAVIVCAGGELPTPLLRKIGIQFETKFGTR
ncbi:MAG TPA: NAD(P)-binding domain-containing protein [Piscinibacter sp.]|jgi:thioredoxin reductase/NAD-dependent dihydropyrimidine dehydrogenase PreA subunit|uniref:NAD(P)-binding domain-containing protein n=1 Tax=Piscinibacter sp. TaxID=1903157 RepID=UPI001B6D5BB0|nr:NAD(P)-binding domain-containing protein [Piscinibacter sp.]MBP5991189.1 NAD(P)-binding domain-containing protein [Piscinibacter sp.]MBP6026494.1 NAD(P)-binding domain-containing protein [Piscinibacter sp.]MBS0440770.1 NAD(P)-binding domain-containing protein [Pseudomonadota bacterium]HNK18824.1 NAD(P)-binding domain-containing protein [Piscinibacter sp.]